MPPMSEDAIADASPPAADPTRPSRRRPAAEVRERRRRIVTWGLSLVLAVLLVNSLVGENGYLASLRARRELAALQASVAQLRIDNQRLQEETRRLLEDPRALEETARRELGLIRPGETLIVIRDLVPAPAAAPSN